MSEPTSKINDLSSETVTKLISILVAIVVFAVVLVPIVNGLADGDGDGGGSDSPVTVSNEQYVLSKMAYGTNPTFEITPTEEIVSYGTAPLSFTFYKMPVIYADAENVIYRDYQERDYVYHITGPSASDNLQPTDVGDITNVVSDGQTVTVNYDDDGQSEQYSFDIASPCYYADANGEYGVYFNPSAFNGYIESGDISVSPLGYDSLYISADYTPHIIGPVTTELLMGYDNGHIWGIFADIKYEPTEYYNISNNNITDAGWNLSWRNTNPVEEDVSCWFMILPNKVTYIPSDTLDNPEPYSLRYKYAEGTIPDFSMDYALPSGSDADVLITSDGVIEIDSSKGGLSYVAFVSNEAVFTYNNGFAYITHEGDIYAVRDGSLKCVGGQLSLVPANNGIVDINQNAPVSEPVSLGTVDWCYYASPLGEYGNYANTQIGNGLYYDSTKPVYSYGVCGAGMVFKDFEVIMSGQPSVVPVTSTIATSDNLYTSTTWTGGTLADGDAVVNYMAILPTSVSVDDGGSGSGSDSAGISGTAGTILKIVPVLVGVGVILAIVALFYDPRNLIKKD